MLKIDSMYSIYSIVSYTLYISAMYTNSNNLSVSHLISVTHTHKQPARSDSSSKFPSLLPRIRLGKFCLMQNSAFIVYVTTYIHTLTIYAIVCDCYFFVQYLSRSPGDFDFIFPSEWLCHTRFSISQFQMTFTRKYIYRLARHRAETGYHPLSAHRHL